VGVYLAGDMAGKVLILLTNDDGIYGPDGGHRAGNAAAGRGGGRGPATKQSGVAMH